ncbi:MAG: hypothetical protein JOY93_04550, partial [Acidobacteriales bacterium]|nr:hypothetical protein [Terriglobales bacterium]
MIKLFGSYAGRVDGFGDNDAYIPIASAIRHWDFHGVSVRHFWGLPYLMAFVSFITRAPERTALLLVSFASSFVSIALAYELWGGWVAAFFAVLNFDWMQRSFLGGAEPLFMALLLAGFLIARKGRWPLAALFSALCTTVRPVGFFALLAIAAVLLWRREFRQCALATLIGLAVGALYALPLKLYFGSP